jgi:hypothetical protein
MTMRGVVMAGNPLTTDQRRPIEEAGRVAAMGHIPTAPLSADLGAEQRALVEPAQPYWLVATEASCRRA